MFKWFNQFVFVTVYTQVISYHWAGSNNETKGVIIFQENDFGTRRLKFEGALTKKQIKAHQYYLEYAVPWREKTLDYSAHNHKIKKKKGSNVIPFKK